MTAARCDGDASDTGEKHKNDLLLGDPGEFLAAFT